MGQILIEQKNLLAAYFEGLAYVTLYLYFNPTYNKGRRNNHTTVMIGISAIMFFVATFHLAIDFYVLLQGYSDSGPSMALHHILKYMLIGVQQSLGTATAIYRTWVLWSYDWKVVVFPIILLIMSIIIGVLTFTKLSDVAFNSLTITYYSVAFALSVMTVGLMSYRIWIAHRNTASDCVGKPRLLSIMWILIESAALQIITEFIILVLSCIYDNPEIIVLEWVPPILGITFTSITVRIKLQSLNEAGVHTRNKKDQVGGGHLRHFKIDFTKEVESDLEVTWSKPDHQLKEFCDPMTGKAAGKETTKTVICMPKVVKYRPVEYYEDDGGGPSYDIAAPPQHSPTDRIHHLHNARLLPSQVHRPTKQPPSNILNYPDYG
ncbi:hypothetical protein BDQ17DRAFT_1456219 [Cyathus striatus]|nr:hypothetical protein BDQ17DRAFT_1456219 [Cyathus striatus]